MSLKLKDTVQANSSTSSKLLTARNFKIGNTSRSFNGSADVTWTLSDIGAAASSHTHDYTISIGRHNEAASGDTANSPSTGLAKGGTKGLYMTETYNDSNTPSSYGNIINISGSGTGQLLCEWSGLDTGIGHLYYRSHRDTSTGGWRPWITILDSNNVGSFACTKSQYDAIISRLNSIDSQLSGVSTALTSLENAVK